ncbi:MAG: hypothetical protein EXS35_05000 [Pedosphaera sp.]|nr:hypothetical protein [Pedosphaera sp.]
MNSKTLMLFAVLAVCLLLAGMFCVQTYFLSGEARSLNGQVSAINGWRGLVQQLVVDCAEYSKQHPAIDPILEPITGKRPAAK